MGLLLRRRAAKQPYRHPLALKQVRKLNPVLSRPELRRPRAAGRDQYVWHRLQPRRLGRDLLTKALRDHHRSLATAEKERLLDKAAEVLHLGSGEEILVQLGMGQ